MEYAVGKGYEEVREYVEGTEGSAVVSQNLVERWDHGMMTPQRGYKVDDHWQQRTTKSL